MEQLPEVNYLLPHKYSMLFVDKLLYYKQPGNGQVQLKIKKDAIYMENNIFQNEWCIEIIAQAVGCVFSYSVQKELKNLSLGFLISIDQFTLLNNEDIIKVDDILFIDVEIESDLFPVRKYSSKITFNSKCYASASMKFYAQSKSEMSK